MEGSGLGPDWSSDCAECPDFRAIPKPALFILQLTEKLLDLENENMMRVAELEKQLLQREKELESIKVPDYVGKGAPDWYWVLGPGELAFRSMSVMSSPRASRC